MLTKPNLTRSELTSKLFSKYELKKTQLYRAIKNYLGVGEDDKQNKHE